jgi:acid stress chaperone HdeA
MTESEVLERAFAMPLTSLAFSSGSYRFIDRESPIDTYRTDPAVFASAIPATLEMTDSIAKSEFIRMPNSTGFGDYTESGHVIPMRVPGRSWRPRAQARSCPLPAVLILMKERNMNRTVTSAVLLALVLAQPALGQSDKPMSPAKMTCEDFLAVDDVYRPTLVYWVAGVDKLGVRETDTMVVDTATPIGVIVEECKKTPKMAFKTKVRDLYKSNRISLFDHH